jgi:hypothetical protein
MKEQTMALDKLKKELVNKVMGWTGCTQQDAQNSIEEQIESLRAIGASSEQLVEYLPRLLELLARSHKALVDRFTLVQRLRETLGRETEAEKGLFVLEELKKELVEKAMEWAGWSRREAEGAIEMEITLLEATGAPPGLVAEYCPRLVELAARSHEAAAEYVGLLQELHRGKRDRGGRDPAVPFEGCY